ncbi:MAG: L,D-transpeptidase, partial [Acidimicrobiales bacterium]
EGEPGHDWYRVQLPVRPNGQEGWIDASQFTLSQTRIRAEVNLTTTSVVVYDGPHVIAETQAVVGAERTPTPFGRFYVAAVRENPPEEAYLGPYALALSGFSEALETFSGGLPVIAIHGTSRPDQVGQNLSNGCVRVPNEVIEFLAENVPVGAPVDIVA